MLHSYNRRFPIRTQTSVAKSRFSTGKGFGCSTLTREQSQILTQQMAIRQSQFDEIESQAMPQSVNTLDRQPSSLSLWEIFKLVFLVCWLWCLVGANFCWNGMLSIANFRIQPAR